MRLTHHGKSKSLGRTVHLELIGNEPYISKTKFLDAIELIHQGQTVDELTLHCHNLISFKAMSYHYLPAIGSLDYNGKGRYWTEGLPDPIKTYFDSFNGKPAPLMKYVLSKGQPFWLSQLSDIDALSDKANLWRLKSMFETTDDGLLIPMFGPFHRRGYVFLSFGKRREFYDEVFIWQLQALLQAFHVKYCLITNSLRTSIRLTARESEVLELITFGKTNPEIGKILGISTSTVAGYVRQIFLKLDVSDRVTAALRARSFNHLARPECIA